MDQLEGILNPEQLIKDISRRLAYSTDASFYHLTPRLVLRLNNAGEVQRVLRLACRWLVPVTFRAAGTSLSGQAISDSVLLLLSPDWQQSTITHDGKRITLQPGIIGAQANKLLAPYGRKIGPDPASIATCKIGGIAANNASGMCCGVKHNSYHTLSGLTFILADGTQVNTQDKHSVAQFYQKHQGIIKEIEQLRDEVRANSALVETIRHQFRFKNTLGYGLNALLDFDEPVEIISHLLIGSEGTLGFIADITYQTVLIPPHRYTGLYLFESADQACAIIPTLANAGADAVELMDARALNSVASLLAPFFSTRPIAPDNVALLIELTADNMHALEQAKGTVVGDFAHAGSVLPLQPFTADQQVIDTLWKIRKGLFPAVGAVRENATTVIIEDVAFDINRLADGLRALAVLFARYQYDEAIIFGHALDGNVHFVFTQRFDTAEQIERYRQFIHDVSNLVVGELNGTLKAEHGTGRNMAPFIALQWGHEAAAVMRRIKQILDPGDILNPGVIINNDSQAHLKHLKQLPAVDPIIDNCIECGFCEPQCPSASLTLTPRQRIALMRRASLLPEETRQEIDNAFAYLGDKTCAATGLCATACPVGIDTGEWIKQRRYKAHPNALSSMASDLSRAHKVARGFLRTADALSPVIAKSRLSKFTAFLHQVNDAIPVYPASTPSAARVWQQRSKSFEDKVVYLVSCPNRIFGSDKSSYNLADTVVSLLNKAHIEVRYPPAMPSLCCGQPFDSHGNQTAARSYRESLQQALEQASEHGRYTVITDNGACALSSHNFPGIRMMEMAQYLYEVVAPRLHITPLTDPVALHVSCSSQHLDSGKALKALTRMLCEQIIIPDHITCCGFAGDKGFTTPALNQAALAPLPAALAENCQRGISNSRTCEIGLSQASGIPYDHIVYLMNEVSKPLQTSRID